MAYSFKLEEIDPYARPFVDASGTSVVDFALGYDPAADTVVLMSVMLVAGESYLDGKLLDIRDLQFGIRVRNLVQDTISPPDFTSAAAGMFIPKNQRCGTFHHQRSVAGPAQVLSATVPHDGNVSSLPARKGA